MVEERQTISKKLMAKEKKFAFALASLKNFLVTDEALEESNKETVVVKKEAESPIPK